MLADFQNSSTGRLSSEFLIKRKQNILPHLKRVAKLPCKMIVLKKRHRPTPAELSESNCPAIQNSCWNIITFPIPLIPNCQHHVVHRWEDIYTFHKPAESPSVCSWCNQEERHRDQMPARTTNVQSLNGVCWRVMHGRQYTSISMILVDHGVQVNRLMRSIIVTRFFRNSSFPPHLNRSTKLPCEGRLLLFSNINILQGSLATSLRCGVVRRLAIELPAIFAESASANILKIDQLLHS